MMVFRKFLILLLFCCCGFVQASTERGHNKAFRTFWHPTYLGQRLNYCSIDGVECGKTLANRYCRLLGYDFASQSTISHNVGLTNYLGTRARCVGWSCNGFMNISCAISLAHKPPKPYHYREKRFYHPRYDHYRLGYCYEQNRGCGQRAANSFCSRMGFIQAKHYVQEAGVSATKTIGSQELCFGNTCNSFNTIVCYR